MSISPPFFELVGRYANIIPQKKSTPKREVVLYTRDCTYIRPGTQSGTKSVTSRLIIEPNVQFGMHGRFYTIYIFKKFKSLRNTHYNISYYRYQVYYGYGYHVLKKGPE